MKRPGSPPGPRSQWLFENSSRILTKVIFLLLVYTGPIFFHGFCRLSVKSFVYHGFSRSTTKSVRKINSINQKQESPEANLRYTTIKILRRFDVELQNSTEIRRRATFLNFVLFPEANLRYTTIMLFFKLKMSIINVKYKCHIQTSNITVGCKRQT